MASSTDLLAGHPMQWRQGISFQVCHSPGKAPPLIFLHGGLGNRYNWRPQYEFAVSQGWETLAYDLAGHGQSQPYSRYSIRRHCRDLTRLLARLPIQKPVLCCHSYGVPIGLEWARQHPVQGLILIAGGTHELAPWWEIPLMKLLKWGGRHFYHLHTYKDKFRPRWESRYLVYPSLAALPEVIVALIRADSGDRLLDYFRPGA